MAAYGPYHTKRLALAKEIQKEGVADGRVLAALSKVPRHLFVPKSSASRAYENRPLAIGYGQTISQPALVGTMTQLLNLKGHEKVLEVGTGSGYQTAILSKLAHEVFTIERITTLAKRAQRILEELGYTNITVITGDGTKGLPSRAPFDAILVTAGGNKIPGPLVHQLSEGGRIVIPLGDSLTNQLLMVGMKQDGQLKMHAVEPVRFVPLIGKEGWNVH